MIKVVNIIPSSRSAESHQDSEASLTVKASDALSLVATAFTPANAASNLAPIFISTDRHEQLLLVGLDGRALGRNALREFIAEPIQIQGELLETGSTQLLKVDPRALRHTPDGLRTASSSRFGK